MIGEGAVESLGWTVRLLSLCIFSSNPVSVESHVIRTLRFFLQTDLFGSLVGSSMRRTTGVVGTSGSHREPVRRQFARNPAYFEEGDKTEPLMIFVTWLVRIKRSIGRVNFQRARGLHGTRVFGMPGSFPWSARLVIWFAFRNSGSSVSTNTSEKPRHISAALDRGSNAGVTESRNWLQVHGGISTSCW